MTAERDFRDFLNDMVHACRSLIRFVTGMSLDDYLGDDKTRFAVMRAYEMLGGAVRHLCVTIFLHPARSRACTNISS